MNEVASDQMPRVWAATIEQIGALVVLAAQFVVMQHLYATYLNDKPESSWLMMAWQWHKQRQAFKRAEKWVNSPLEVELVGS